MQIRNNISKQKIIEALRMSAGFVYVAADTVYLVYRFQDVFFRRIYRLYRLELRGASYLIESDYIRWVSHGDRKARADLKERHRHMFLGEM